MHLQSLVDRLIFVVTNAVIYVRHPKFTRRFRVLCGEWPNYACPPRHEALVQWRKLFDRNPLYISLTDKIVVKTYLQERFPQLRAPETVWTGLEPERLPDQFLAPGFVIKTNNSRNQNYFPHKSGDDRSAFLKQARRWIDNRAPRWLFWIPVKRRFLAERLIEGPLVDISVRVHDGHAWLVSCATDFKTEHELVGYFWADGTRVTTPDLAGHRALPADFSPPPCLPRALAMAKAIGKGWDYLRVDFLAVADEYYLSEITIYPTSGYAMWSWRTEIVYRFWLESLHLSWPLTTRQPWPKSLYINAFRRWLQARKHELGPASEYLERQMQEHGGHTPPAR